MNRREFFKTAGIAAGAATCSKLGANLAWAADSATPVPAAAAASAASQIVVAKGVNAKALVQKALEALGGIEKFVKAGQVVVVKPNIGWDRSPELAANTNPDVVAELVRLCMKAGAKQVKVFDNTCNDARRSYKNSGIEDAAKAEGATVSFLDERLFRKVAFPNAKLFKEWEVYGELLDADVFINVPIAKHHALSKLTLGMKNHFGVIGGQRGNLHKEDIHQNIADLAAQLKPQLTVLDAMRILTANGPTGGNPQDVKIMNTIVMSSDPVAVDSFGSTLFGMKPDELEYVKIASAMGLGKICPNEIKPIEVTV